MQPKVCLIGGTGRSGTKILKKIFQNHPDFNTVPKMGEWRLITDPDGIIDFYNSINSGWSPYYFDVKLRRLRRLLNQVGTVDRLNKVIEYILQKFGLQNNLPVHITKRYIGVNLNKFCPEYPELVNSLINELTEFKYRAAWTGSEFLQKNDMHYHEPFTNNELSKILGNFLRSVMACITKNNNAKHFIEDSTFNICWFDKILQILPEAKLVHIYRDPRDVVASFTNQRFTPKNPQKAAKFYKGMMQQWQGVKKRLSKEKFLELSLEELVNDPERQLKKVCRFYGVKYTPKLLNTNLGRAHSGRWKKDLASDEQKAITKLLEKEITSLGYTL
ncbi:MAG: sulfotransferase family protein [Nanobdellota archaeon]